MPETTTQLTPADVEAIETRRDRCLDNKYQSKLAEAAILISSDIPALIRDWRALSKAVEYQQGLLDLAEFASESFKTQAQGVIEEVEKERDALRAQLAEMTKERDDLQKHATDLNHDLDAAVKEMNEHG